MTGGAREGAFPRRTQFRPLSCMASSRQMSWASLGVRQGSRPAPGVAAWHLPKGSLTLGAPSPAYSGLIP